MRASETVLLAAAPIWEANHVWLVFDLVIFWTAFPHAFPARPPRARGK